MDQNEIKTNTSPPLSQNISDQTTLPEASSPEVSSQDENWLPLHLGILIMIFFLFGLLPVLLVNLFLFPLDNLLFQLENNKKVNSQIKKKTCCGHQINSEKGSRNIVTPCYKIKSKVELFDITSSNKFNDKCSRLFKIKRGDYFFSYLEISPLHYQHGNLDEHVKSWRNTLIEDEIIAEKNVKIGGFPGYQIMYKRKYFYNDPEYNNAKYVSNLTHFVVLVLTSNRYERVVGYPVGVFEIILSNADLEQQLNFDYLLSHWSWL